MIKRKTIISLIASGVVASTFLLGCGNTAESVKEDVEEGADKVENGAEDAADDVKNAGESLYDKVTDNSMDYSKDDLIKDLNEKGITTTEFENTTEYFTAEKYGYKIGDETIYVYQYDSKDEAKMKTDINSIKDSGTVINESTVQWKTEPHIYKKGRTLVMYDGNNKTILDDLADVLGNPVLG